MDLSGGTGLGVDIEGASDGNWAQMTTHPSGSSRRLAAVWFADIVGYSGLVANDEGEALRIVQLFQDACRRAVEQEDGRLVKFIGDAALAVFPGTAAAVRATLALRHEFNAVTTAALRIGVHVGDVVGTPDGDLYGEGINVAHRLQQAAKPGQVLVSGDVRRQIRQRLEFEFQPLGKHRLKGVDEPVPLYAVTIRGGAIVPTEPVALPPESQRKLSWAKRSAALAILIALMAVGLVASIIDRDPDVKPYTVVVTPFNVADGTTNLDFWRVGLVDVLSINLDGAGPLRTISTSRFLRDWKGRADRESARELGIRTQAEFSLYGNLLRSGGDSVRVDVSILEVKSGEVIAEIQVSGVADKEDRLTDSLTTRIITELGKVREIGAVRRVWLGQRTERSALKHFLHGEQAFRRSQWDSAAVFYGRAVAEDSTFALAARRLADVLGWARASNDETVQRYNRLAARHNHNLPPRDSLLVANSGLWGEVAASVNDSRFRGLDYWRAVQRIFSTLGTAVEQYPDDPEVWYAAGDALYHYGDGPGSAQSDQVLRFFRNAIILDPLFAPSYVHPIEVAFQVGGAELALDYTHAYLSLRPTRVQAEAARLIMRLLRNPRISRSQVQELVDSAPVDVLQEAGYLIRFAHDPAEVRIAIARELLERHGGDPRSEGYVDARRSLAYALAYRGHLREAFRALGSQQSRFFTEIALLGGVPADTVRKVFDRSSGQWSHTGIYMLPWLAMQGDTLGIHAWAARAESAMGAARYQGARRRAAYDVESARAYLALARADTAEAIGRFASLPRAYGITGWEMDRLPLASLLMSQGRYEEVLKLSTEWRPTALPSEVMFALLRGRAAERLDRREEAVLGYGYVIDAWAGGDPELRSYVDESRAGLRRLGAEDPAVREAIEARRRKALALPVSTREQEDEA